MTFIPHSTYKTFVENMPIVGLEAVVLCGEKVLLLRRNNPPAQGEWWFPGGRLRKGESFEDALRREVKEETGLNVKPIKFVGVYNRVFPERHDVALVFLCKIQDKVFDIKLNDEHSEFKFFVKLPNEINPFIIEVIEDLKI